MLHISILTLNIAEKYSKIFNNWNPLRHKQSLELIKILLNLFAGENMKLPILSYNSDLDIGVIHLAFKSLF